MGGGVQSCRDIRQLLNHGADKVSINTAAIYNPQIIKEASSFFGSQCVVCAIDARRKSLSKWEVYTHGGSQQTGIDAVDWAKKVEDFGAGEILLTSIDTDGTMDGFDLLLTRSISESVKMPVIASGGGGKLSHFKNVLIQGKADAVLAASVFHFKKIGIKELKVYLSRHEIAIRES